MQRDDKTTRQRTWFDEWTTTPAARAPAPRAAGASAPKLTDSGRRVLRVTASDWMGPDRAEKPKRKP